jgi:hypothetical protein
VSDAPSQWHFFATVTAQVRMPTSFDRIATSLQPYWRQDSSMGPDPRAASQRRGKTPARCRPCCGVAGVMERSGLTLGVLRRGSPLVRFERHRALSRTSLVGRDKPCGWRVPLVAAHQLAIWSASVRSSCDSSPPIGEASRIAIESRSYPVKTRWSPGTSRRSISDIHQLRLPRAARHENRG